ncbi:uncharacterized protein [Pyxicephalus adspersus]|uniref:uncharacterized protein isoform X2 n=1 Tax=Pyxicephalus adspersus TaxID=30357 RepID=UPI003B5CBBDE
MKCLSFTGFIHLFILFFLTFAVKPSYGREEHDRQRFRGDNYAARNADMNKAIFKEAIKKIADAAKTFSDEKDRGGEVSIEAENAIKKLGEAIETYHFKQAKGEQPSIEELKNAMEKLDSIHSIYKNKQAKGEQPSNEELKNGMEKLDNMHSTHKEQKAKESGEAVPVVVTAAQTGNARTPLLPNKVVTDQPLPKNKVTNAPPSMSIIKNTPVTKSGNDDIKAFFTLIKKELKNQLRSYIIMTVSILGTLILLGSIAIVWIIYYLRPKPGKQIYLEKEEKTPSPVESTIEEESTSKSSESVYETP